MELFGFEITRKKDELRVKETPNAKSFVPPVDDDDTPVIQQHWVYIIEHMVHMSIWKVVSRMSLNLFEDTVKHH